MSLYILVQKPSGPYYIVNTQSWSVIAECSNGTDANTVLTALNA